MTSRRSEDLGFKELTLKNWREDDRLSAQFARPSLVAGFVAMSATDWAQAILAGRLDERVVPLDVIQAFEVARGCML